MSAWPLWWIGAYLAGSIPFGLLIGLARGIDVRQHGSGNIGATNVWRTLGKPYGILAFALDFLKGLGPTLAAGLAMGAIGRADVPAAAAFAWLLVAVATIAGHIFPLYLRFKGGKGVATGFGAVAAVFPFFTAAAVVGIVVWYATLKISRYVGVASCVAAVSLPVTVIATGAAGAVIGRWDMTAVWPFAVVAVALAALVVWRHRGNLARVRAGTEPRVGDPLPDA